MADSKAQGALGVDIGGTRIRVGVVTDQGAILALGECRTPSDGEPEALAGEVARLAEEHGRSCGLSARAGVALPGIWERDTTVMSRALNLPRLEGVRLRDLFEKAVRRPVVLESDVNAAALAQYKRWAPAPDRFVYLSVGSGVGGAVILDGELVRHTRGGAGHFGHLVVDTSPGAPECRCGARGCLESVVGGAAFQRLLDDEYKASRGRVTRPEDVFGRAARGLAIALLQIANLYAPEVIALGGGVVDNNAELVGQVRRVFRDLGCTLPPGSMCVERAPLSTGQAGVIGAGLLALAGQ